MSPKNILHIVYKSEGSDLPKASTFMLSAKPSAVLHERLFEAGWRLLVSQYALVCGDGNFVVLQIQR